MKKLIVAFAAVVMAVGANAAALDWKTTAIYHGNDSDKIDNGSVGYLILSSSSSYKSTIIAALAGVGATDANTWITANTVAAQTKYAASNKFSYFDTEPGQAKGDYYAYAVIFDTETVTDASNFYVTDAKAVSVPDSGAGYANWTSGDVAGAKTAAAWSAVSVPEPTSGLLLLLGMAGLALRRRHA